MARSELIQSVLKAVDLLRVIADSEDGLRLSQVAATMNQKVPAVHHLAKTLESVGFIKKTDGNALVLGEGLAKLAEKARGRTLLDAAAGALTQLHNSFPDCVVVLADVVPPRVELALRISHERPNVIQRERDQVFNIYVNAVALVSLAAASPEDREMMTFHQPFSEYGAHLWKNRRALEAYLDTIRAAGYAVSPFDRETSYRIAAPIISRDGRLAGALGISAPTKLLDENLDQERMKYDLMTAATAISERLRT